jgi:hypothetical protein
MTERNLLKAGEGFGPSPMWHRKESFALAAPGAMSSVRVKGTPSIEVLICGSKTTSCAMPAIRVVGAPIIEDLRCGVTSGAVTARVKSASSIEEEVRQDSPDLFRHRTGPGRVPRRGGSPRRREQGSGQSETKDQSREASHDRPFGEAARAPSSMAATGTPL